MQLARTGEVDGGLWLAWPSPVAVNYANRAVTGYNAGLSNFFIWALADTLMDTESRKPGLESGRKRLVMGNWKMHGNQAANAVLDRKSTRLNSSHKSANRIP